MIDFDTKKKVKTEKGNRYHVRVVCDECGDERWSLPGNARKIKTPGHLCRKCRGYGSRDGAVKIGPRWMVPVVCPECGEMRLVRGCRADDASLCKHCRSVKVYAATKVGIRDENGKTCPGCGEYKPYSEFWLASATPDGYQCRCKDCQRAAGRKYERVRIARKRGNGGSFTVDEWEELCAQYENLCLCCGDEVDLQADHIVPVSKRGTSDIDNIQPLCADCNVAKSDKTIDYRFSEMVAMEWF